MKTKTKRRKMKAIKVREFISEDLARFIPPVSRMGGTNPVDWRWGMKPGEYPQGRRARTLAAKRLMERTRDLYKLLCLP